MNAAGAWVGQIAKMAGIDLPVEPLRRMLVPTEPFDKVAHSAPMIIDMSTGFHFRPGGARLADGLERSRRKPGYKTNFDRGFIEKILTHAVDRVPVFEEAGSESVAGMGWVL